MWPPLELHVCCFSEPPCPRDCCGPLSAGWGEKLSVPGPQAKGPWTAAKSSNTFSSQQPAGLCRFTQGYQPQRIGMKADGKEGKGLFVFLFFTRLSSLGKRKEESCSELVPCQAPSPPLLVQALHRLYRLHNSNFWKHWEVWASPEAVDSWSLFGGVLGLLCFTLILLKAASFLKHICYQQLLFVKWDWGNLSGEIPESSL